MFGRWRLCRPPCCWRCSSCPSSPCWPSRCLTSCRSPSQTRTLHRHAALWRTSVEYERDTHLLDINKASETSAVKSAELLKLVSSVTAGPPFCLRGLSVFCPGFGASDLEPLQQRFLLRVPLMLRSPDFQSGSFSLSGITTTLCSGALRQQSQRNLFKTSDLTVWCFITLSLFHVVLCLRASLDFTFQNKCKLNGCPNPIFFLKLQ